MNFLRKNFRSNSKGLNSPATVIVTNSATTLVTYTETTTPRAIRCDADGVLEVTDFSGNTSTMNVLKGEVLPIMPETITANTTIATQSLW